jgi:hypothetical protein
VMSVVVFVLERVIVRGTRKDTPRAS